SWWSTRRVSATSARPARGNGAPARRRRCALPHARRAPQGDGADPDGGRTGPGGRRPGDGRAAGLRRGGGEAVSGRRYYDAAIQTMPLERLRRLQAERLARQLDRVWSIP